MALPRILIVEDESLIAKDIATSLEDLGYDVVGTAVSGEDAIAESKKLRPNLVLMDIVLQGEIDGIQAAARIRADLGLPVIFLTAYADDTIMQRAKLTEPFGYLIKPFEDTELHFSIQMALYKHKMEHELKRKEEQYRALVEMANIIPFELDFTTGRFTYMSPQVEKMLGYPLSDWTGIQFMLAHTFEEDKNSLTKIMLCQDCAPGEIDYEFRFIKADGSTIWLRGIASIIRAEDSSTSLLRSVLIDINSRKRIEEERENLIGELQEALANIKTLRGLVPICAWCKKVRDDNGFWNQVETYIQDHSDAKFTHGMCPDCMQKMDRELDDEL